MATGSYRSRVRKTTLPPPPPVLYSSSESISCINLSPTGSLPKHEYLGSVTKVEPVVTSQFSY